MLFNSYSFLMFFLPITVCGFFILGRFQKGQLAIAWLVLASLFFYGFWNPTYLFLITGSMVFNYWAGKRILSVENPSRPFLAISIGANLAALGYFKYANFFVDNLNLLAGSDWHLGHIVLPLAISFFTFQQIAYLVDTYRREAEEYSFLHYALFVTFFPQLIAGPIVHHGEMLPQFREKKLFQPNAQNICIGITLIAIGLFKKVVIADNMGEFASRIFNAAERGQDIWFGEAWGGALAYTFQLYFDFSGYVDMAMGSARIIGIKLPINFHSPYKSLNIIDFWRRWHKTLSRFLRDYLYIAMGGNRKGETRRYVNLMATMLLGGLWHGASWTFVFWGFLHGIYLVVNHSWHALRKMSGLDNEFGHAGRIASWVTTFLAVVIAWVFFRAESFLGAKVMLTAMSGYNLLDMPAALASYLSFFEPALSRFGTEFNMDLIIRLKEWVNFSFYLIISFLVSLWLPSSNELFEPVEGQRLRWTLSMPWALLTCFLFACGILNLTQVSEFLYFNF